MQLSSFRYRNAGNFRNYTEYSLTVFSLSSYISQAVDEGEIVFAKFQILAPLWCQGWDVKPQNVKGKISLNPNAHVWVGRTIEIDTLEYQQTEKIETELRDVDMIRIRKVYACCPGLPSGGS